MHQHSTLLQPGWSQCIHNVSKFQKHPTICGWVIIKIEQIFPVNFFGRGILSELVLRGTWIELYQICRGNKAIFSVSLPKFVCDNWYMTFGGLIVTFCTPECFTRITVPVNVNTATLLFYAVSRSCVLSTVLYEYNDWLMMIELW